MQTKDGIVVELRGGLGNQLFILLAGWAQSERLGCPLYLDVSNLERDNIRSYALGRLSHPGILVSPSKAGTVGRRIRRRLGLVRRTFVESSFNYDSRVNSVQPGWRLEGYFQSPKYFRGIEDKVLDAFSSIDFTSDEAAYIRSVSISADTHAHIRRGDYLLASNQTHHGLASTLYFIEAKRIIDTILGFRNCRVFTDSPNAVSEEFESQDDFIVDQTPQPRFDDLIEILAMSKARSFIMSNSSFSWWAAWLMAQSSESESCCIAPRPWFTDGTSGHDLLLSNWLTLGIDTKGV